MHGDLEQLCSVVLLFVLVPKIDQNHNGSFLDLVVHAVVELYPFSRPF